MPKRAHGGAVRLLSCCTANKEVCGSAAKVMHGKEKSVRCGCKGHAQQQLKDVFRNQATYAALT